MPPEDDITGLLGALQRGDPAAREQLFHLVYQDLHHRAHRQLARGRPGDTLSTTALVHETYLKLVGSTRQDFFDRGHFFAVAARAMRQILVDYARSRLAGKRGGGTKATTLEPEQIPGPQRPEELLALDEALTELARMDERLAQTVELRFFGGLSVEETAVARGVSPRTVKRDWRKARAFLYSSLRGEFLSDLDGPETG